MARQITTCTARTIVAKTYYRVMGLSGLAGLLLSLAACNVSEKKIDHRVADERARNYVADGDRGLAQLNPNPTKAYELTVTIHDAPGPFAIIRGRLQYDVINFAECGQIHPMTGNRQRINSLEEFPLVQITSNQYRGRFYLDLMQDEDYYGNGTCRWELNNLGASLRATGTEGDTRFSASEALSKLLKGETTTLHYPDMDYPRAEISSYPSFGESNPRTYKAELQDQLFSISLKVDEVTQ